MTDDPTEGGDEGRTLTVRVGSADDAFEKLRGRFATLDDGERPEPLYEVVLQHEEDLERLLGHRNVELLRTIAREEPASIRETARLVDRDVRQVHDNLRELERMNLLRFEEDGRARRPVVWYTDLTVELPIDGRTGTTPTADD